MTTTTRDMAAGAPATTMPHPGARAAVRPRPCSRTRTIEARLRAASASRSSCCSRTRRHSGRRPISTPCIYTPHAAAFGRFMSPSRFAASYGPPPRAVRHVLTALRRAGLSVTWHPGDDWLDVAGPARRAPRFEHSMLAFGVPAAYD